MAAQFLEDAIMPTIQIDPRSTDHLTLPQTDVATIARPAGVRLTCAAGIAWVTQGAQSRDLVLYPGQSLLLDRRKPVHVSALQPCTLRIQAPLPRPSVLSRTAKLVSGWVHRTAGVLVQASAMIARP
jgi:Protein of unknown function (DUF2917)